MTNHPNRNKRMPVNAIGRYRKGTAVIKAAIKATREGREYLDITPAQIKTASDQCCYAGTDYVELQRVDGYTDWQSTEDNGAVAYKIEVRDER